MGPRRKVTPDKNVWWILQKYLLSVQVVLEPALYDTTIHYMGAGCNTVTD
jgi:hypothetical protein